MGDENWLGRDPSGTLQEESTWPAERTPGRLDAERAHRPLDSSFVHSFKLALANDQAAGATINYLNDVNEGSIYVSNPGSPRLPYPLMLFSHFPSVPSEETLRLLVNEFSEKVHPRITILRSIPIETLTHDKVPKYLTLAMACLGCFAAEGMSSTAENMWWAANFLITATLEVDNREARKADLISAWAMLETYGALSADLSVWHRTNITHGYVETAARRLLSPSFNESEPSRTVDRVGRTDDKYSCSAVSYFVLIDVLRSVHYGLPSTLSVFELLTPTTFLNGELNSIYSCIVLDSRLPLSDVSIDSTVLALVSILTDIHTLSTVFHALEAENSHPDKTDPTLRADRTFSIFHNPYLPFSPANENRRVNQKLHKALDLWGERYLGRASKDIVALFYFSKMYLNLPSLRLLPIMAGYTPGPFKDQTANSYVMRVVDSELCDGSEALKNAWIILENIETSEDVTPVWFPVILFYASLVVWRMISLQPGPGSYGSIRVLHLFKSELEKMKWPCCGTMVKVLESLLE